MLSANYLIFLTLCISLLPSRQLRVNQKATDGQWLVLVCGLKFKSATVNKGQTDTLYLYLLLKRLSGLWQWLVMVSGLVHYKRSADVTSKLWRQRILCICICICVCICCSRSSWWSHKKEQMADDRLWSMVDFRVSLHCGSRHIAFVFVFVFVYLYLHLYL